MKRISQKKMNEFYALSRIIAERCRVPPGPNSKPGYETIPEAVVLDVILEHYGYGNLSK